MSELEMTSFEARLERRVQAYADIPVRDFDATDIARDAVARTGPRFTWPSLGRAAMSPSYLLIITGLLLALVVAIVAASLLLNNRPAPIGRNGLIAYAVSDLNERPYNHIHLMNADGTNDREIAEGSAPRFSADGKWLTYFTGWGMDDEDVRIIRANADGSDPIEISGYQQLGYAFSPDASLLMVRLRQGADRAEPASYWLIEVESGERQLMMADPPREAGSRYWDLLWSPDSKSVAFNVMQDLTVGEMSGSYRVGIDVLDVETGTVRRVTSRPATDSPYMSWSPDARYLAYNGVPDGSPEPSLNVYGPDNDSLYPDLDLFVVAADGSSDVPLSSTPLDERDPRWSPDGGSIAYHYWDQDSGEPILVVQEVERSVAIGDPREYRDSEGMQEVVWSPDSQTLLLSRSEELEPLPSGEQQFRTRLELLDPDSDDPPTLLSTFDSGIGMTSWQWLEP